MWLDLRSQLIDRRLLHYEAPLGVLRNYTGWTCDPWTTRCPSHNQKYSECRPKAQELLLGDGVLWQWERSISTSYMTCTMTRRPARSAVLSGVDECAVGPLWCPRTCATRSPWRSSAPSPPITHRSRPCPERTPRSPVFPDSLLFL